MLLGISRMVIMCAQLCRHIAWFQSQVSAEGPSDLAVMSTFLVNENHVFSRKKSKRKKSKRKITSKLATASQWADKHLW